MATSTQARVVAAERSTGTGKATSKSLLARVPGAMATLFTILATACALLALVPLLRNHTEPVQHVATSYLALPLRPNLALAAFLGLVAASLRRRTRVSWWIAVLFYVGPWFLASLTGAFANSWLFIAVIVLGVMLGLLIAARQQFTARVERGNGWRALGVLVLGLALASVLGYLLILAFPGSLHDTGEQVAWAVNHAIGGLGSAETLDITGRPPAFVSFLCGLFGAAAFLAAAWVLFRPRRSHAHLSMDQEVQIRSLLARRAIGTRSATSPPAGTRRPSSRPAASRR